MGGFKQKPPLRDAYRTTYGVTTRGPEENFQYLSIISCIFESVSVPEGFCKRPGRVALPAWHILERSGVAFGTPWDAVRPLGISSDPMGPRGCSGCHSDVDPGKRPGRVK